MVGSNTISSLERKGTLIEQPKENNPAKKKFDYLKIGTNRTNLSNSQGADKTDLSDLQSPHALVMNKSPFENSIDKDDQIQNLNQKYKQLYYKRKSE